MERGSHVREMFAAIAPRYDLANRVLTAGADEMWRRRAIRELAPPAGGEILDVCTGTGDLAFGLLRADPSLRVVAVDFCEPMLASAQARAAKGDPQGRARFVEADVHALPFGDDTFHGATMGFSMRNVVDIVAALREIRRVLRPGARFVNLDVAKAENPWVKRAFDAYFYRLVPLIGGLVGGSRRAYTYLPQSLTNYPDVGGLCERFEQAGFAQVRAIRLAFGSIALHVGTAT
ncbi:MAG: bifunctional demethylmenaquinone methyltransferase/2-methoxy-6-polyprenyl-1,4-benzoquinol methylase UbiE [Candidatus Eremiobacteraeota bacterium]|nr:bifunctional demethylmenaquinone methyltransferase/2-methoxy-6-polyprenyl-1,4-benzoquinol methylase UbiE [Candidatus Eremiobacteraeota bacterium]MBV8354366.1 bifunctional demethylmenaquinone methyltransferase/2-methoxy-6-polyprenyl-1,4-benzoquinol methylase UbiE [Candidatus Eremiobacteraeota bacterium]